MRYVVSPPLVTIAVTFLAGALAYAEEKPPGPSKAPATAQPAETAPTAPAQAAESPAVPSVEEMNPPVGQRPAPPTTPPAQKPDEATLAAVALVKGAINEEGKICYREKPLGSRFYKKVCKTKEEIHATAASAQDAMRVMRSTAGSEKGN